MLLDTRMEIYVCIANEISNQTLKTAVLHRNIGRYCVDDGVNLKQYSGKIGIENNMLRSTLFRNFNNYSDFVEYAAWIIRDGKKTLSISSTKKTREIRTLAEKT